MKVGTGFRVVPLQGNPMKTSGKVLRCALEYMTQCILLPGVELHFDELLLFYAKNIQTIIVRRIKN
jgi:hypothetical protein